jgi:hypothetical protein
LIIVDAAATAALPKTALYTSDSAFFTSLCQTDSFAIEATAGKP